MNPFNLEQRGIGVLVVHMSTTGAADESFWVNTERELPGSSFLQARARFGPGSAVGSAPWAVRQEVGSDQRQREVKLHLPYFNLADGARSTDASLLVEIVELKRASEYEHSDVTLPDDDESSERSSSLDGRQTIEACQQGHRAILSQPNLSKILAVARLDVQTALAAAFGRGGAVSATVFTENNVVFNVAKTTSAGGATCRSCPDHPGSIPVSVKLSFSKPSSNATTVGEQLNESTIQRAGREDDVPAFFVVATTLFDCVKTMKEAELRVYIRYGDTGSLSKLSAGSRGQIVVHESFEWNISADLSTMFADAKEVPHARRGATLIIALVDKAATNNERSVSRKGRRRNLMRDPKETAVGVLELSCEELVSCGPAGRWRPLRACLSSTHQTRRGCVGRDIVGEVLVAFAWMPREPATYALPKAPADQRLRKPRKRPRRRNELKEDNGGSQADPCRNRAEEDMNISVDVNTHRSHAEPINNRGSTQQRETLLYIHVWDALLPLDRPDSAFYFTVRLSCRGSRVQRTSTKPARGRGGLRRMSTTAARGSDSGLPCESTSRERSSSTGFMHVVWDEHLLLRAKGPVEEGAVVELVLRDASVDDETAHYASREGAPFQAFAERLGLEQAEVPTTSGTQCSSTSFDQPLIPSPVVYRLKLQPPSRLPGGGTRAPASTRKEASAARNGVGFGGVEVRMAGLVISRDGTNADGDEDRVEAFLRRKADVARIPDGVKTRLSNTGGDNSAVSFSPMLLPAQKSHRPRHRQRLLDLSAANGLFHQFAEGETGERSAVETTNTGWSSPRAEAGGKTLQSSGNTGVGSMERSQSSSEPVLTDGGLGLVTQHYFPRLAQQAGNNGIDSTTAISEQSTARCSHPAAIARQASHGLSFAGFVSWLRNLPQDDLGTAGLLVSPRTALQNTGRAMDEDAQGLAAALQLAREPTATLIGGWCSIPLTSTTDSLALDRVRIGWGRGGGGDAGGGMGGAEESEWRRHTELLQRDVAILRQALAELEQRCGLCGDPKVRTERAHTSISTLGQGVGEDCDVDADANGSTRENEQVEEFDDLLPTRDKTTVSACGDPAAERNNSECCSVAALYIGQEAARLGSAAEHLKEALRCAGDTLSRNSTVTPGHRTAGGRFSRARTDVEKIMSPGSSHTHLEAIIRSKPLGDGRGCHHQRCYGLVLQHIKQVTAFQTEIAALQRRAATIAQQTEEKTKLHTPSKLGQGCCSYNVPRDTELPRSALALVKRIRRARSAARRHQPPEPLSSACDVHVAGEGAALPLLHEQDNGVGLPSSPIINNRHSLGEGDADRIGQQLQQDRAGSSPPYRAPAAATPARDDGGISPQTLASPRAPFIDMLRGPTLLQNLRRRFENIRSEFDEKGVELPAIFSKTSAERVLEIARGVGQETGLAPLAALCCPIDRFALHVFRTAGAAEEGGSAVFTSVQELAGIGGLETHATEKSLWTAAAQAGIVDVDRWVVAAVLWQVADAVGTASAQNAGSPHLSCQASMGAETGEKLEGGSLDEHAGLLAEAKSLWKELRDEAFLSVLGRTSGSHDQGAPAIEELGPSSTALSPPSPTRWGQEQPKELLALARDTSEDGNGTEQHPRQKYNVLQSDSSSFDLALMRTLAVAGRAHAGLGLGAATQAGDETGSGSLDAGGGSLKCVENILLHNFVIAGFVGGSSLDVSDIVNAVRVRRQRALSAAAAAAAADVRSPCTGTAKQDADNLIRSSKNQHHPVGGARFGGLCEDGHRASELFNGDAGASKQLSEGDGDSLNADGSAVVVPMEPNVEARILAGIPFELRDLFRAAALAKRLRQQQQQQEERQEVGQEGSTGGDEIAAAEQKVSRVLDNNRTLESAPFADGRTALHHAATRGDDFLVRLLLERGCQPHLKDFEGKRACDLTRDLKCLRLLGALKKAPEPSAVSLRTRSPRKTAMALGGEAGDGTLEPPRSSARAMTSVEFALKFRRGVEEAAELTLGSSVRTPSETPHVAELERGEEGRADIGDIGTAVWVEGVARSYDVRNKMLFIDANGREIDCGGNAGAGNAATPGRNQPTTDEEQQGRERTEQGQRRRSYARHVLDVRLLSCLSSQGEELFDQLRAFSGAFKAGLARASLDVAIDAAADVGAVCREAFDEFVFEIVKEGVATEAYRSERLAVAARRTATTAVGSVLRAAQRAVILARRFVSGRAKAARRKSQSSAAKINDTDTREKTLRVRTPASITAVENSSLHVAGESSGESSLGHRATSVDKSVAARMCFRCTAIVTEKRRKVPRRIVTAPAAGVCGEDGANLSSGVMDRKRHDLQYLARWTIQGGFATVVVRGSSYLNAVASEKRGATGCRSINLEGRDAGVERVLEYHGVPLSACLQTFDVMQDMEDPSVVLDMLAAGVCQLSTRYAEEGIEVCSLCQSDQDVLQADVRGQLYHAGSHGLGAAPEWDELSITMQAYGGVTSVRLVRNGGGGKTANGGKDLVVSAPTAGGWCRPEEAAVALTSPPPSQETVSSPPSSSPPEPLPPSAVDVVLALMRCNPCEVLGSLCPGVGVDGRISLIGQANNSGPCPTVRATKGGKDKAGGGGYGTGESPVRERHRGDGEGTANPRENKAGGGSNTFRCSVEIAWDKDEGGVFVQRFGMEPDERRPRFNLRAVGIRGFSVTQLPVTLEDIDEVWDQTGSDSGSHSGASTVSDRPQGSSSSSSESVRSSEGGGGGGEGEGGGGEEGDGAEMSPPEQGAVRTAKSAKANVLERAEVAAVECQTLTASETAAQAAVTSSTRTASDKSSEGDAEGGKIDSGSSGSDVDRRSGERSESMGAAVAAETAAGYASPEQSIEVIASVEDRCEADGPPPVQDETRVEDKKHMDLEATQTNEEPVPESSVDNMPVADVGEGRKGQQEEEECEINQQVDGNLEAKGMEGGNGEGVTVEQDQNDGLAGPGVGAAELVEPMVEHDDGEVLHRGPSEGHAGSDTDLNNDVGAAIAAAECVDESDTEVKPETSNPSEGDEDTPDTVVASDPDDEPMKHPTEVDTSRGMPVEDGNGDVGEPSPQRETTLSPTVLDNTRTASTISEGPPPVAGGSEQESTDVQDAQNAGDNSQRADDETALEKETLEREQNVDGQTALGHEPGGVGGTGADEDNVDTPPADVGASSVSREGSGDENATDEKTAPVATSRLWGFPPEFEAVVTLSTENEAVVECAVEGEIAPELEGGSRDKVLPSSWKSVYCLYKIAAGQARHPSPQADIDLEDDEAQARLEDLLELEYGLAMEDVLERFSPDTDLGCGEAVVRSFTDSICQLRPTLLVQPQNTKGEERHDGGDRAVYKAVGAALRGGGEVPEWREMQVRVGESRVLEVGITTNTSSTTIEQRGQAVERDGGKPKSESGTINNIVVDCSGVASPAALRAHLVSEGVPASAVDALERAGFVSVRFVVDLAGVLAALAQEAESRKKGVRQFSLQKDEGERRWPGVDPDRDGTQVLRVTSERKSGNSLETVHECRVAVTGSSDSFKVEISPVFVGDDDAPSTSVVLATISGLRPLGTPAVTEKGWGSETHAKNESRENVSSARTPPPEDASSRREDKREADTAGLNVGDRVEARFGGKTEWFPGTVRAINAIHAVHQKYALSGGSGVGDGGSGLGGAPRSNLPTIAIDYDDGDAEERVPRVRVRLPGQKQPRFLNEGDEVDVKRGKKISLARVVVLPSSLAKEEGHYDLQLLDDGRRGIGVGDALVENCPRSAIMALHGWPPARK